MIDTGCALESLAMRSSGAATGTRTTMQACSISTTTGPTTTTTTLASADPTLKHLDAGHAATEGSILVESIPQDTAKARRQAKPKTAAVPTGAVVEHGKRITQDSAFIIYANPDPKTLERRIRRGIYRVETDGLYKFCNRCKEYWPADSEFFFASKSETDGLVAWCKACYIEWRYPNGRRKTALLNCNSESDKEDNV